jgi:hypothetical protein
MHLVSGRHLLGTVREAQDILLGQGANASRRPTIETSRGTVRLGASSESRESPTGSSRNAESDRFGRAHRHEKGSSEANSRASAKSETDGNDVELGNPSRSRNGAKASARDGAEPSVSDFQNAGQHLEQANGTENGTRDRNGSFGGWTNASEEGSKGESARSLREDGRSGQKAFVTLELTQHGDVLAVATREWVPLGESGNGMENGRRGVEEAECIDCISIYAVNWCDDSDEERDGLWEGRRDRDRESDAWEEDQESCMGKGERDRTGNGSRSGNGEGSGSRRGIGDGNGNGLEGGEKISERDSGRNGWAEDIENLAMRYKRPRLLARIFGLKEKGASIDVFHEGDVKTHTLLQYRTPLVSVILFPPVFAHLPSFLLFPCFQFRFSRTLCRSAKLNGFALALPLLGSESSEGLGFTLTAHVGTKKADIAYTTQVAKVGWGQPACLSLCCSCAKGYLALLCCCSPPYLALPLIKQRHCRSGRCIARVLGIIADAKQKQVPT